MCTMKLKRPTITADLLSLKPIYYVYPHGSGIVKCDPKVAMRSVKERGVCLYAPFRHPPVRSNGA